MKKVFQTLGLKAAVPGLFGIEIEAEGTGLEIVDNKFWNTERDGSLRGEYPHECAEFVLKKPIKREEVVPALKNLLDELEDAKFAFSFRTSVHVHVNVQDLTHVQLLNLIYTYLLLEEPMMTYCGKERKGNRFCLRLADAEGVLNTLYKLFHNGPRSILDFPGDNVRYSAINIAALQKYGSLEFRAMRGNLDVGVIHTWTEAIYRMREFAIKVESPKHVLDLFQKLDPEGFIAEVLGDITKSFVYPRMVRDMQRSLSLSIDLPYAYRDVVEVEVDHRAERNKALRQEGYAAMPEDLPFKFNNPPAPQKTAVAYYLAAGMFVEGKKLMDAEQAAGGAPMPPPAPRKPRKPAPEDF